MKTFGLIGKNLANSFSKNYFKAKFISENIVNTQYLNFEIKNIEEFKTVCKNNSLIGLNVTIPYKESIIKYLDDLSKNAKEIGAVNTILFLKGKKIGFNTDYIGFKNSIKPLTKEEKSALILGDGGAAKAVKYALNSLNIKYKTVTRFGEFTYSDLTRNDIKNNHIIINTTPLGSKNMINKLPEIPYEFLSDKHILYDLNYNPKISNFLKQGIKKNCHIKNGKEMLKIQAEESWKIWSKITNE